MSNVDKAMARALVGYRKQYKRIMKESLIKCSEYHTVIGFILAYQGMK